MITKRTFELTARVLLLCGWIALPARGSAQTCGNGVAEAPEECDDGNLIDGDGCSSACLLENASARCDGVPTSAGTQLDAVRIASGLSSPVHVAAPPLDPNRLFVVEKTGNIRIIKNGTLLATPFLSLVGRVSTATEQGLLSVAFHPNYKVNHRLFVYYTDPGGNTVVARYEASAGNPDVVDPSTAKLLLIWGHPFKTNYGGQLAFGPDGYLYVGMGDGGGVSDPLESGQTDTTLLGKLLRLDVDVDVPPFYAVPPSNPNAAAGPPLGLIWAKGLRNPRRFSFDDLTGDLYLTDLGESQREEVDFTPVSSTGGENYGWDIFDGSVCYEPLPLFPTCPAPGGYVFPVYEYPFDATHACGITGGFVYRGCALPDLHGTYFFSDFCGAFVRTFEIVGGIAQDLVDRTADVAPGGGLSIDSVSSFGEDARGELYIADQGGEIFKLIPAVPTATPSVTPTPTDTWTPPPSATATASGTATESATATATATETATATASDTATPVDTATSTATAIDTATATDTPAPPTATATATDTPVPPTATATATNTPVPPTWTANADPAPTNTPRGEPPTRTATRIATRTSTRPREVTRTATATATATATPDSSSRCRGDIDGNGRVDRRDSNLLLHALYSSPGDPRWNPKADLNHNGFVGRWDLRILARSMADPACRRGDD